MDAISLTLRLHSDGRFKVPRKLFRSSEDLEEGSWYEVEIKNRVKGSDEEIQPYEKGEGAMQTLIAEKS